MRSSSVFLIFIFFAGCFQEKEPHITFPERNLTYATVDTAAFVCKEVVYVPVYSDIYNFDENSKFLLTATLSLRNTSLKDSLYIDYVKYYDSKGNLLRNYLDSLIVLMPLEAVDFVVEHLEKKGGTGANFIVEWGATHPISQPVIQAVMIGTTSQQGISFVTEAVTIKQYHKKKPHLSEAQD